MPIDGEVTMALLAQKLDTIQDTVTANNAAVVQCIAKLESKVEANDKRIDNLTVKAAVNDTQHTYMVFGQGIFSLIASIVSGVTSATVGHQRASTLFQAMVGWLAHKQ